MSLYASRLQWWKQTNRDYFLNGLADFDEIFALFVIGHPDFIGS